MVVLPLILFNFTSKAYEGSHKAKTEGDNNRGNDEIYTPAHLSQAIVQKVKSLLIERRLEGPKISKVMVPCGSTLRRARVLSTGTSVM